MNVFAKIISNYIIFRYALICNQILQYINSFKNVGHILAYLKNTCMGEISHKLTVE